MPGKNANCGSSVWMDNAKAGEEVTSQDYWGASGWRPLFSGWSMINDSRKSQPTDAGGTFARIGHTPRRV